MAEKHTPTPWQADEYETQDGNGLRYLTSQILDRDGRCIVEFSNSGVAYIEREDDQSWDAQAQADATFIVNACNAHGDLVDALRGLLRFNEELCADIGVSKHYPSADRARAALAKLSEGLPSVQPESTSHAQKASP